MNAVPEVNSEPFLLRADADGVSTLTLNRPGQFNALSREMLEALLKTLAAVGVKNHIDASRANFAHLRPYVANLALIQHVIRSAGAHRFRFADTLEGVAEFSLTIHFPVAGKRLGGKMKDVGAAAKAA
mgnify:CR=1 FL=1